MYFKVLGDNKSSLSIGLLFLVLKSAVLYKSVITLSRKDDEVEPIKTNTASWKEKEEKINHKCNKKITERNTRPTALLFN